MGIPIPPLDIFIEKPKHESSGSMLNRQDQDHFIASNFFSFSYHFKMRSFVSVFNQFLRNFESTTDQPIDRLTDGQGLLQRCGDPKLHLDDTKHCPIQYKKRF